MEDRGPWRDGSDAARAAQNGRGRLSDGTADLHLDHGDAAAAAAANKAKTDFLARMSHELRTPLNSVIGFAELLAMDDDLSADQRQSVEMIRTAGDHLLGLINEVLEISRIEAGAVDVAIETVAVEESVADAIRLVHNEAAAHSIEIHTDVAAGSGPSVRADPRRLRQVLLNLLSNAVKYSWPGGVVDVLVSPVDESRVEIAVRNTGLGIRPEDMDRLFQPFERLQAPAHGVEGTGLGLTLTKHLVEVMAGSIGVTSGEDGVTTFTLTLPRARRPGPARATLERHTTHHAVKARVLLVEDALSNLELVQQILGRRPGIELISADRGELALILARVHRPDLILLDLGLPDMDGTEVMRLLRADPQTAEIPVVVVTADVTPRTVGSLRGAGARAYLTKPLRVAHFLSVVDAVLGAHLRIAGENEDEDEDEDAAAASPEQDSEGDPGSS